MGHRLRANVLKGLFLLLVYVHGCFVPHMCMWIMCMPGTCEGHKSLDAQGLGLQEAVSHHVCSGN